MHTSQLKRTGLVVLLAGQLLPMIDFSIVNVALDAMSQTLRASPIELALIVAVYGIAFAICLAMGGRLGDNVGRRTVFQAGVAIFGVASLLCGIAHSVALLMFARALQGVGAALIVPQILATLHVTLSGRDHARAIGLYGGIGGLAFIIGQVLGGFLIKADIAGSGWRSVFLINLPLCLFVLMTARRAIPETRNAQRVAVDIAGTLLLASAIGCLMLALALGPLLHWSWPCWALLALFPALLLRLRRSAIRRENAGGVPLLPPSLLRLPSVRFGLTLAVLFFSCWSGFMFAVALTLQASLHMTAFESGNAFIALGAAYFVGAMRSTRTVERYGKRTTLLAGCAIQMSGLLALIATFQLHWSSLGVTTLIPATLLIGFGQSFIVSTYYRIGMQGVPHHQAGAASAVLSTVQQTALGLGPMLLGAIYTQIARHGNPLTAISGTLVAELIMMSVLVLAASVNRTTFQCATVKG
ncbi:MFS transporter [Pantoea sp. Mb-10]|uniref:MFS transporter n=1 Tax=unclassified Pantoea TaxID=2630326 RepID=UPI001E45784F|nr:MULTISPECIES: MFS transporter [unclassified Pantoea]MCE0491112.1 MFS transporter [Pantoea sp. Mb-10]MCE0502601.1 MFS transporter [Pantoea sp. Pb-8]